MKNVDTVEITSCNWSDHSSDIGQLAHSRRGGGVRVRCCAGDYEYDGNDSIMILFALNMNDNNTEQTNRRTDETNKQTNKK